jgi:hypothetical protein
MNNWIKNMLAEPQLEVYTRAAEIIKKQKGIFSCGTIKQAILELAKKEDIDMDDISGVVHMYKYQYRRFWTEAYPANVSELSGQDYQKLLPYWWNSFLPEDRRAKVRALTLFRDACFEPKVNNYFYVLITKKEQDLVYNYAKLMQSKYTCSASDSLKRALNRRCLLKTGRTMTSESLGWDIIQELKAEKIIEAIAERLNTGRRLRESGPEVMDLSDRVTL